MSDIARPLNAAPNIHRAYAQLPVLRWFSMALLVLSAANYAVVMLVVVRDAASGFESAPPLVLARSVFWFSLVPQGGVWLLGRLTRATVELGADALVLLRPGERYDVPYASLAGVVGSRVPLPASGATLGLRLSSGRRFRFGLMMVAPAAFLRAFAAASGLDVKAALDRVSVGYAEARAALRRWWIDHPLVKLGLFPLVPMAASFISNQYITYGGPLGGYHLLGLQAYLKSLGIHWIIAMTYAVVFAALWRGVAEMLALLGAWLVPRHALLVRRGVEGMIRFAYYGIPAALLLFVFLR